MASWVQRSMEYSENKDSMSFQDRVTGALGLAPIGVGATKFVSPASFQAQRTAVDIAAAQLPRYAPAASQAVSQVGQSVIKQGFQRGAVNAIGQIAKWGTYAYLGVEALKYGISQVAPIMARSAAMQSQAWYGQMGEAYHQGVVDYAADNAQIQAEAYAQSYQSQSPIYQQTAAEYALVSRAAEYYASQRYPMEYGQATTLTPQQTIMPYKVRIQ